jgi:hypothetical protein
MSSTQDIYERLKHALGSDDAVLEYIQAILAGKDQRADLPRIKVRETVTLAKFDGEYEPGKEPVEVTTLEDHTWH